jgi:hypothetical protein
MKEMRHIKLFEAFESVKLSKTLKFINDKSKSVFLDKLKKVLDTIDFPYSELSDDIFEYLPFNKALKKSIDIDKEKCDYESSWIPGEFCKNGKVKRTWGAHVRDAVCPKCDGTGYLENITNDIGLIKFWFDKDGNFINLTGVDGNSYNIGDMVPLVTDKPSNLSKDINDYVKIKSISLSEITSLPEGSLIYFTPRSGNSNYKSVVGYLINYYGSVYIYQDEADGGAPSSYEKRNLGRNFGRYSWAISERADFSGDIYTLGLPKISKSKSPKDNYSINFDINIGTDITRKPSMVKSSLQNAHFSIIMDFKKLKSKEFKKKTEMIAKRESDKKGAFKSNEEIKNENIERYIKLLIDKYDLDSGFKNINRLLSAGLSSYPLDFISSEINISEIENLLTKFYLLISGKITEKGDIDSILRSIYNNSKTRKITIVNGVQKGKEKFKDYFKTLPNDELMKKRYSAWLKWEELNEKLFDKLSTMKIDSLSDLELTWSKIIMIQKILYGNNPRFESISRMKSVSYYIATGSYNIFGELSDYLQYENTIDSVMSDLEKLEDIIEKI